MESSSKLHQFRTYLFLKRYLHYLYNKIVYTTITINIF